MNRRNFFALCLAPLAAPLVKFLPAKEPVWWLVSPDKISAQRYVASIPISKDLLAGGSLVTDTIREDLIRAIYELEDRHFHG